MNPESLHHALDLGDGMADRFSGAIKVQDHPGPKAIDGLQAGGSLGDDPRFVVNSLHRCARLPLVEIVQNLETVARLVQLRQGSKVRIP